MIAYTQLFDAMGNTRVDTNLVPAPLSETYLTLSDSTPTEITDSLNKYANNLLLDLKISPSDSMQKDNASINISEVTEQAYKPNTHDLDSLIALSMLSSADNMVADSESAAIDSTRKLIIAGAAPATDTLIASESVSEKDEAILTGVKSHEMGIQLNVLIEDFIPVQKTLSGRATLETNKTEATKVNTLTNLTGKKGFSNLSVGKGDVMTISAIPRADFITPVPLFLKIATSPGSGRPLLNQVNLLAFP